MKTLKTAGKFLSALLALCLTLSLLCVPLFAAEVDDATIDTEAKCSLTIYKYDFTAAKKDGVWNDDSFISTGWKESYVETTLGGTTRTGAGSADSTLGNGGTSKGYAIKGVEFTILKVADITTYSRVEDAENKTEVLYGFNKDAAADLLDALGLTGGAQRYTAADSLNTNNYYYTSDTLNKALSDALGKNSTTVKNALESYIAEDGIAMDLTDENGMSKKSELSVGLYLVVETKVPEMVTSTTDPFFVSLPMTTVDGNEHADSTAPDGGHAWNYDVTVYPKNNTGIPTLEKTLRENKEDTGKNGGSDAITDGYDHNATASAGDVIDYQILSTLPTITSKATALTDYSFLDTITEGVSYTKGDVVLTFYKDKACTEANKVATWKEKDAEKKFDVTYGTAADSTSATMTIRINTAGLAEINGSSENENGALYAGYSNYTLRITYTATVDSNAETVLGEEGNCNEVVLTWKRTSSEYYDTLNDDCHLYTFGIDLTKTFSDKVSAHADEQFAHVKFKMYNKTDSYWVKAELKEDGVYYVTDHVTAEADATAFVPKTAAGEHGKIVVRGLEDDTYELTEIETANGYTLLKDKITVVISTEANGEDCDVYSHDAKGLLQNDPRFKDKGNLDDVLTNIPQKQLSHKKLTASATVDSNAVTMEPDGDSINAFTPLTVVNTTGFTPPKTGDTGMGLFTVGGLALSSLALVVLVIARKKTGKEEK